MIPPALGNGSGALRYVESNASLPRCRDAWHAISLPESDEQQMNQREGEREEQPTRLLIRAESCVTRRKNGMSATTILRGAMSHLGLKRAEKLLPAFITLTRIGRRVGEAMNLLW